MKNCTKIVMLLDRSGSMSRCKTAMNEVMNGYIENQKESADECSFSLVQFDDKYEKVVNNMPIQGVGKLTLEPRGSTALLDAIGRTIDDVGKELAETPERQRPSKVLFIIITDGMENASHEYIHHEPNQPKAKRINDMVGHQREKYAWQFVFLGADQDAMTTAAGLGFDPALAMNFRGDSPDDYKGVGTRMCKLSDNYRMSPTGAEGVKGAVGIAGECGNKISSMDTAEWDEMQRKAKLKKPTKI